MPRLLCQARDLDAVLETFATSSDDDDEQGWPGGGARAIARRKGARHASAAAPRLESSPDLTRSRSTSAVTRLYRVRLFPLRFPLYT